MRIHNSGLYLLGALLIASGLHSALAAEGIEVVTAEGQVTVEDAKGKEAKPVHSKSIVEKGNVLATGSNSRAVVRVSNDGFVVMGKDSKVELTPSSKGKPGLFKQLKGVVYYAINSIKGKKRAVEVRTATTTIGIRGTRFLVTDTEGSNEIGMRKGEISITNDAGEFEIHKQTEKDEFEAFKKEGEAAIAESQREFAEYKEKTQKEFVEYKKEFSLSANRMAVFDGNRVVEKPLSEESQKNMESFEEYAEDWLNKVKD